MSILERLKKKEQFIDVESLKQEIRDLSQETAIYVGADSKTFTKRGEHFIAYVTVVVIHMNGREGAYMHRQVEYEKDYSRSMRERLMNEVYKAGTLAAEIAEEVGDRPFAVHLDINPDPSHKSSVCVKQATGYILGTLGFKPDLKPEAFAATTVSDRHAKKMGKKSVAK